MACCSQKLFVPKNNMAVYVMAILRSQEMDLEEGRGGLRDRPNSVLGNLQRNPIQAIRSINESMKSYYHNIICLVNSIVSQLMSLASVFPSIWCLIKILIDPFYLYTSLINYDNKCVTVDDNFWPVSKYFNGFVIAIVMISVFSLFSVVSIKGRRFEAPIWLILVVIDLWTYVGPPSSQQPLKAVFPAAGAGNFHSSVLFLLLYFARVTLIYVTFTRATKTSATIWAKAAFNLLLYILGGHVFGGLWYSFAIGKVIECWKKACKKYASKCSGDAFVCDGTLRDSNFLNEFCPAKTQNRAIYDFGIYRDALESNIVETTNLPKKILYCFRWGLQNLSALGQSLQASTDVWENIFVISITIYSMALFVFFIGNVQIYLQSKTIKSEMIRQKKQQIEQCTSFAKLSEDLQKKIKRYQPDIWEETKGADFEFLFNLPEELRKNMKRELCLELLKKVDEFRSWNAQLLEELCDCVKPVSYAQNTEIVQKGSSIDQMLFLVQGKLQTSLTSVDTGSTANPPRFKISIERLEEGGFCGKELVDWFQVDLYPSNLPISTRTIQTITKVDAFALMSYDLQNVFIKHQTQVQALPPADSQPQAPLPAAEPPVQQPASGI
ncbi:hypothetical protein EZV62_006304 [Acer yangbiense]|uniref:Cyclic nucleotide-binding domain-containing protein n=1 Tax=Acer yangbiense TaxID=1000413 RepID=A0A5C7IQN6_9ROSI|nr:hypothetical protein EZV62_006304 [Acer yangbiense]